MLFWHFTQGRILVSCRGFGTTYRSRFKGQADPVTLKDGSCKLSWNLGRNYCYTLRKIAKERRSFK